MTVEGQLEFPREGETSSGGVVRLRGWVASRGAPIRAISVTGLNGRETALPYGSTRPDVAEELGPSALRCGFDCELALDAGPARAASLAIWAELMDGGRVCAFERGVSVGAVSAEVARARGAAEVVPSGELCGALESPPPGRHEGVFVEVRGWLLSRGAPIRSLSARLDGAETPLSFGILRADLAASWNGAFGAEVSGFRALVPIERRGPRDALLELTARFADGRRARVFTRALRLAPPPPARGEPRWPSSTEEWSPRGDLHGVLEDPRAGDGGQFGTIHLRGWLLTRGAPIRALWLAVAGAPDTRLSFGHARPEIAEVYPWIESAREPGFRGVVHLGRRSSPTVELRIFAELDDGARVPCFSRTVRLHAGVEPRLRMGPIIATTWTASMELLESDEPVTARGWLDHFKRAWSAHQQRQAPPPPPAKAFSHAWQRQDPYLRWRALNRLTPRLRARMEESARALGGGPVVSVVVPVFDPPLAYLRELIESVRAQIYPRWELCLADDASTNPEVRAVLEHAAAGDPRIKIVLRAENGHIVEATNSALALASGEFVALVDHDDLLTPDALLQIAECAAAHPDTDWIYTDEDKLDEAGFHYDVQFKGAWNPEMAITHNFSHHLTVLRRSLVDEVGRMRRGFEGAQELDLFLRVAERTSPERIRHVAHVCYHWRAHPGSTASRGKQKRYVFDAARRAIEEAVARRGLRARPELPEVCDRHELCLYQLKWDPSLAAERPVTIVIPTRDRVELLRACVESLERTVDARYARLIIVDDDSREPQARRYLDELARRRPLGCRVVRPPAPRAGFNYSRLVNFGSRLAETPYVLHLNNDVVALERGWLEDLVGWMSIDGVGAAGARLLYPDGSVQHAGVIMGLHGGLADHAFHHLPADRLGYLCLPLAARDVSAVTGACLLTDAALYRELGGFDEQALPIEYNDIDYCLKVIAAGRRVVYSPGATLRHLGSASRGRAHDVRDHLQFLPRHAQYRDPWFNPHLRRDDAAMTPDPHHYAHAARADRPLRLLLVTHNLNREGAPLVALDYARHFARAGHRITVLSARPGPIGEAYQQLDLPVEIAEGMAPRGDEPVAEWRARLAALGRRLGLDRYDVVVVNSLASFWAVELAALAGLPSVWHVHEGLDVESSLGTMFLGSSPDTMRGLLADSLRKATRVVFQARTTQQRFDEFNVNDHFRFIAGGISIAEIDQQRGAWSRAELRARHDLADDEFLIVQIATICERKGQAVLVDALGELGGAPGRRLRCVMVGEREDDEFVSGYQRVVRDRVAHLGLGGVVRIDPETPRYREYLAMADLFVLPSYAESFPRILLEAMAFGVPIIASHVFGVPEMVQPDEDGLILEPGDPKALARAILRLVLEPELRARLEASAAARVRRVYDSARLLERHLELMREAVLA